MSRIVCHFSCGAASAVTTKLILAEHGPSRVVIYNAFVVEEDDDNRRFLADCEKWFNHPITVLRDTKYGASAREVWRQKRFMNSALGAPCSSALKRDVIEDELAAMGMRLKVLQTGRKNLLAMAYKKGRVTGENLEWEEKLAQS